MKDTFEEDPTLVHARRELRVVVCVVVCVLCWTILVCATDGFSVEGESPALLWGMPRWAVLGILLPWLFMLVMNFWLGFWFLANDDLSRDNISDVEQIPTNTENETNSETKGTAQ